MNKSFSVMLWPWLLVILIMFYVVFLFFLTMWHTHRQNQLRKLFDVVITNLNKYDVHYWIDFGTLLGVTRDQDIIFGDNDVDICMWDTPDNHEKLKKSLAHIANKYLVTDLLDWGAYRVYGQGVHVDIYVAKQSDKFLEIPDSKPILSHLILPTRKTWVICNKKKYWCSVPGNIKEVLETRYGNYLASNRRWYFGYLF